MFVLTASLMLSAATPPTVVAPVVEPKNLSSDPGLELSLGVTRSVVDKYVEHVGLQGATTLHFNEWFAVSARVGWLHGAQTTLLNKVDNGRRAAPIACNGQPCEPELPDQWQATWFAGATAEWAPLYGKLSLMSELEVPFSAFAIFGLGAEGIRNELLDGSFIDHELPRPVIEYGAGVRAYVLENLGIRLALSMRTGLNPNVVERDQRGGDPCPTGQEEPNGTCSPDVSHLVLPSLSLSYRF